jgi:hypothetical protein
LSFIPLIKGKITAVVLKMPTTNKDLKITFYELKTGKMIRTEIKDILTAGVEVIQPISA